MTAVTRSVDLNGTAVPPWKVDIAIEFGIEAIRENPAVIETVAVVGSD
jgi:hypothetical protein